MAEITREDLLARQRAMLVLMEKLPGETDTERITAIANQLQNDARELEALALAYEKQELAKAGPPPCGSIEIVLTPEQKKRIYEQTGVSMETVVVRDESGVLNQSMPHTDPRRIEQLALVEAKRRKVLAGGDDATQKEVARLLDEIEA